MADKSEASAAHRVQLGVAVIGMAGVLGASWLAKPAKDPSDRPAVQIQVVQNQATLQVQQQVAAIAQAVVEPAAPVPEPRVATGVYILTTECVAGCTGTYVHKMTVTGKTPGGGFEARGYYIGDPSTTWVASGKAVDRRVSFSMRYVTGVNVGYTADFAGDVIGDDEVAGMATTSQGQSVRFQLLR